MSLTDSRRLWKLAARPEGVHSHEARKLGISGNPSQRAKDIADHVPFWTKRERRNGRPGSRWWADGFQPDDATPVKPNFDVEGGSDGLVQPEVRGIETPDDVGAPAAPLSAEPVALFDTYDYTPRSRYGREEEAA